MNTRRVHLAVTLVISAALCLRQVYAFYRTRGKDMATAGTACYLGGGYFLTAKHVVIPEAAPGQAAPRTTRIAVRRNGQSQMLAVQLIDHGNAREKAEERKTEERKTENGEFGAASLARFSFFVPRFSFLVSVPGMGGDALRRIGERLRPGAMPTRS